jgi:3-phosphoshikimate 1-carboxyvinyltransferase
MRSIAPGPLDGVVRAPPSKSAAIRAVAAAVLAETPSTIAALPLCDDVATALGAAIALGAGVVERAGRVEIHPGAVARSPQIDCRESGLCIRMFAPIAALSRGKTTLTAAATLAARPVGMLSPALRQLGARCETAAGRPPVAVEGPLRGGAVRVDGGTTSQLLTGLILALPLAARDSIVSVDSLGSRGYVDLTLDVLRAFGGVAEADADGVRYRVPGGQRLTGRTFEVEGDWSAAAFLLVAGAVAGRVAVRGLDPRSRQPDRRIVEVLAGAGADVGISGMTVVARRSDLAAFEFDGTNCPDLIPPLAALAACCRGWSIIRGADRLGHKESDRSSALLALLARFGCEAQRSGDALSIRGGGGGARGDVDAEAYGDHRIAMAAAVLGLGLGRRVRIRDGSCVAKSYARFFEALARLRAEAP